MCQIPQSVWSFNKNIWHLDPFSQTDKNPGRWNKVLLEKELSSKYLPMKYFRYYLEDRTFTIYTDQKTLVLGFKFIA